MKNFKKVKNLLKQDLIVIFILELLVIGYQMYDNDIKILNIVLAFMVLFGYFCAKEESKVSGIIGIVLSSAMLLISFLDIGSLLDLIIGIILMIHSVNYNNCLNNKN